MAKLNVHWEKDGYVLRLGEIEDAKAYYEQNFNPLDPQMARLTGCKTEYTKEEVMEFFKRCINAEDRYDLLIISPQGEILGESVLNEIDWELRCANFRIGMFHSESCGRGIGSWAIERTLELAFDVLKLHRVELDVFSFNPRAIRAYEKAGFKHEGVRRDALMDHGEYADDLLMAMLEDEWRERKCRG